jgi:hypothetical protein
MRAGKVSTLAYEHEEESPDISRTNIISSKIL